MLQNGCKNNVYIHKNAFEDVYKQQRFRVAVKLFENWCEMLKLIQDSGKPIKRRQWSVLTVSENLFPFGSQTLRLRFLRPLSGTSLRSEPNPQRPDVRMFDRQRATFLSFHWSEAGLQFRISSVAQVTAVKAVIRPLSDVRSAVRTSLTKKRKCT